VNIGLTGADGLLGRTMLERLRRTPDVTVTALTRRASARDRDDPVVWLRGDLRVPEDCDALVQGVDVLLHFAHTNSPLTSDRDWAQDAQENLIPTLNLLSAVQRRGRMPHLVYPSSGGAVYGNSSERRPFRETDRCLPPSSYGVQKLATEYYLRLFAERGLLTATILRIGNAYGWLLPEDRSQGLIGTAINRILHGHPVRIIGDPHNVRDYVHGSDIAQALWMATQRRQGFEVFNIGTGVGSSVMDILRVLGDLSGHNPKTELVQVPGADLLAPWCVLDIGAASAGLGWQPKVSLEAGIAGMLATRLDTP
jgi:UDP-glucose 4-epimerase